MRTIPTPGLGNGHLGQVQNLRTSLYSHVNPVLLRSLQIMSWKAERFARVRSSLNKLNLILTTPLTRSRVSVTNLIDNAEKFGKAAALLAGFLYVVGLLLYGLYTAGLHVRSFELIRVKYVFVGTLYCVLAFSHLVLPALRTGWLRIARGCPVCS